MWECFGQRRERLGLKGFGDAGKGLVKSGLLLGDKAGKASVRSDSKGKSRFLGCAAEWKFQNERFKDNE